MGMPRAADAPVTEQQMAQADSGGDGLGASLDNRLAQTNNAFVGVHLEEQPAWLDEDGLKFGDFHQFPLWLRRFQKIFRHVFQPCQPVVDIEIIVAGQEAPAVVRSRPGVAREGGEVGGVRLPAPARAAEAGGAVEGEGDVPELARGAPVPAHDAPVHHQPRADACARERWR